MGTKWTENKTSFSFVAKWFNNYKLSVRSTENFIMFVLVFSFPVFMIIFSGGREINNYYVPYNTAIVNKDLYITERLVAQSNEISGQVSKKIPVLEKFREVEKFTQNEKKTLEDVQGLEDIGVAVFDTVTKRVYSNKTWVSDLIYEFNSAEDVIAAIQQEKKIMAMKLIDTNGNPKVTNGFVEIYFSRVDVFEGEIRVIEIMATISGIFAFIFIAILIKKLFMINSLGFKLYKDSLRWGYLNKIKNAIMTLLKRNIFFAEVLSDRVIWIIIAFAILSISIVSLFEGISLDGMFLSENGKFLYTDNLIFGILIITPIIILIHFLVKILYRYEGIEFVIANLKSIEMGDFDIDVRFDDDQQIRRLSKGINDIRAGYKTAIEEGVTSEKLKTELISNVSHDLKTPLTSIINYVNIIQRDDISDKEREEYIDILDQKAHRLKDLIEDLFEVSKMNSGKIELDKYDIDIVQLIHQSISELEDYNIDKNMEFKIKGVEELIVNMDGMRMARVFQNLGTNALKYGLDNTRVYINIQDRNKFVEVSFKNISEYELDFDANAIVERFYRGDKSRNSGIEGSGLGLAITKSIIELHEGKFRVECEGDLFKAYIIIPK